MSLSVCPPLSHSYNICSSRIQTHLKTQTCLNPYCYSLNVSTLSLLFHVLTNKHVYSLSPKMFPCFPDLFLYLLPFFLEQPSTLQGRRSIDLHYTETFGHLILSVPQAREKTGLMEYGRPECFLPLRALLAGLLHCQCLG